MQFLYFLPNVYRDSITPADVTEAGLHDILRDRMTPTDLSGNGRLIVAGVSNGPGGLNGTILQCAPEAVDEAEEDKAPEAIGYFPVKQTWEKLGGYWIGYDPEDLPDPSDLERDHLVGESELTLGDGRVWFSPVIRTRHGKHRLPDVWRLIDGKFVTAVKPDWSWAWELSGAIWDWYTTDSQKEPSELFEWSVKLLGINYRIGPFEAGVLGILGSRECTPVLYRAIGGLIWDQSERQKKVDTTTMDESGMSSSPGVADCSLNIPQPVTPSI